MKKITFGALLLISVIMMSCKKDQTETPTTTGGAGATVTAGNYGFDGSASLGKFLSTKAGIVQVTANGSTTFTLTAIKDGGNQSITIILLKKAAVGKFALGPAQTNGGIIISKDYTKASDGTLNYSTDKSGNMQGGGEVNITKLDGATVEGTFYAIAYNSAGKEAFVEQGSFSGKIQ